MRFREFLLLAISTTILNAHSIEEAGPELDLEYYSNLEVKDSDLNLDGKDHTYDANLFEGDIAETNFDDPINGTYANTENRNAIINMSKKWPGGIIPYLYYGGYNKFQKAIIAKAITRLQKVTCLKMKQRTNEANYIYIKPVLGCYSHVGCLRRGQQELSLTRNCFYVGTVLHELMHAVGFHHEQSRVDRDNYVQVNLKNVIDNKKHNFRIQNSETLGAPYDYCSVMHYSSKLFSKNNLPTIVKKQQGGCELDFKNDYSDIDIRKMNTLYKCSGYPQLFCSDQYTQCKSWASTYNYCRVKYVGFMSKYCKKSCGLC